MTRKGQKQHFTSPEELSDDELGAVLSDDAPESGKVEIGDLTLDYDRRRILRKQEEIRLTPKEFDLFVLLARNRDRVLRHRAILKAIWGPDAVEHPEHLWVLVSTLRKKIEPDPFHPRYLLSEPWIGYCLRTEASHSRLKGGRAKARAS
jgi:two-component system KDP operon response regulator KdpE